jgi:hypothetical protein
MASMQSTFKGTGSYPIDLAAFNVARSQLQMSAESQSEVKVFEVSKSSL